MSHDKKYNHSEIEAKWQTYWDEQQLHKVDTDSPNPQKKFYNLVMFPYPSGDKLHIGHWFNYSGIDILGRLKKLQQYTVFQPIGFDSFGLPAENYAIKTRVPPQESTQQNIVKMRQQLKAIGTIFDWSHEVVTSDPAYYKFTQWLFQELYRQDLAYQKEAFVNWDPIDQTVLANEQVLADGTAERSGAVVEKKLLKQWFFKITEYAEELLDHSQLDWPEKTVLMQKNWIGKSLGAEIYFPIKNSKHSITVFTTRPDTLYGATFLCLAPENQLIPEIVSPDQAQAVEKYLKQVARKTEIQRTDDTKEKTGVPTGAFAIHPLTKEEIPIYIADFVIGSYAEGAIMSVPAHDQRDFDFATKYQLPILPVVTAISSEQPTTLPWTEQGITINSEQFNGLSTAETKTQIIQHLETHKLGKSRTNYRLHDWLISRQRYWGAPIPIVYDPEGNPHLIPEKYLPWILPTDVEFKPEGSSPLTYSKEFHERTEKLFGKGWTPEYDTIDTFICSSWYFLRYLSPNNQIEPFSIQAANQWLPTDLYIGGPEHACMHLLYARFINIFLYHQGYLKHKEPFKKLVHQGLITKDGAKMSKSKGNVVSPDEYVEKYGSDVFRMYLMFTGPFTDGGDFNDKGITGIVRFRDKLLKLMQTSSTNQLKPELVSQFETKLHQTIQKVTNDLENFHFNTAISALMEFTNFSLDHGITPEAQSILTILLAPLAPHLAEEIWQNIFNQPKTIFQETWPTFDPAKLLEDTVTIAVQVNGKLRADFQANRNTDQVTLVATAQNLDNVAKYLADGPIRKTIVVPNKLINFVV